MTAYWGEAEEGQAVDVAGTLRAGIRLPGVRAWADSPTARPCHRLPLLIHDVNLQPVVRSTLALKRLSDRFQLGVGVRDVLVDTHDGPMTRAVPPHGRTRWYSMATERAVCSSNQLYGV